MPLFTRLTRMDGFWFVRLGFSALIASILGTAPIGSAHANSVSVKSEKLAGDKIAPLIAGKRIYLAIPLGGELPLYYRADGYVDGSGEAIGLGRFLAPSDSGKWWVENDELCQQWTQWYNGRVFCFKLEKLTENQLVWRRDDGEEGLARLGE